MNREVIRRLLGFIRPYRGKVALALLCAVVGVGLQLLAPVLIGDAINCIVAPGDVNMQALFPYMGYIALVVAGSALATCAMTRLTNTVAYNTVKDLRTAAFRKLQTVPLNYIDTHAHGDIVSRIVNDIDQVADGLLQGFTQLFTGIVTIAGTLIFMLAINPMITLVVVLITPVSLLVAYFIAHGSHRTFQEQMKLRGEISAYAEEMIAGQKVVKAFAYEKEAQKKFDEINERLHKSGVKSQFLSSMTNPTTRFINAMVYAGVGITGAVAAIGGTLNVGQLSSFLLYANQYTRPFNEISGVVTELQTAFASAARVFGILDEPNVTPDAPDAVVLEDAKGQVCMDHVYFSYVPSQKLIEDFSMCAEPGQRVAIVGPTGSGKTTIINLLMRFYDVNSGEISVDGINIDDITRDSLRAQYGMVLQEMWLKTASVKDNIAFGRPDASMDEVVAAAREAGADGFIRRLSESYDTILSDDGSVVSQGQKQLLCIARVMITRPHMLILDEATSNIDTRTEMKIQEAFGKLMKGHTTFIVAHRLSTIREADIILVLKDGGIVEQGSHEELLKKGGFYAKLWNSQFAGQEQAAS
ncbi:MAG: ABC transporter ATP-binding protein [Clostridia bacterium]|nr:ABC transporter ATP-binding protein [Clostridia bacterium]